ncbi:MAG: hypothetical protein JW995_10240 [Melioribacteraceae bacterium]|nr:hypothetical protein [Melioribacteraceae bacterium]
MKKNNINPLSNGLIFIIIMVISFLSLYSCRNDENKKMDISEKPLQVYDSLKAKEYGADDYGMKPFVMAFLKRGPNRPSDSAKAAELQMAHLKNISRMAEEGKLVLAGPFMDSGELRGIYVFNVPTVKEAKALTETDPAIQAGSLVMELKPWYGSAALVGLNEASKSVVKKSFAE